MVWWDQVIQCITGTCQVQLTILDESNVPGVEPVILHESLSIGLLVLEVSGCDHTSSKALRHYATQHLEIPTWQNWRNWSWILDMGRIWRSPSVEYGNRKCRWEFRTKLNKYILLGHVGRRWKVFISFSHKTCQWFRKCPVFPPKKKDASQFPCFLAPTPTSLQQKQKKTCAVRNAVVKQINEKSPNKNKQSN